MILDANGSPAPLSTKYWPRLKLPRHSLLFAVILFQSIVILGLAQRKPPVSATSQRSTVSSGGGFTVIPTETYGDVPLQPATAEQEHSLQRALAAWRLVLPRSFVVPNPPLFQGIPDTCESRFAIACANLVTGKIVISKVRGCDCDMDTVLMHEVGHLLGVPHIEGDALMDASYQRKLLVPTGQAIALALLHSKVTHE